eukprot:CAMPEP_0115560116 /NCGR_PEP_ID=MMETSP0271-20121206/100304_1 /TAXON_ID=71861 /ORGANISM="Scrippsiella trochoidea, Strain CCMP3099" /LENGTH=214 /DNA_ID=CAMNT_0002994185 /DNA_START=253 /DNA_END=893 /DNA_ORIENTATION=+
MNITTVASRVRARLVKHEPPSPPPPPPPPPPQRCSRGAGRRSTGARASAVHRPGMLVVILHNPGLAVVTRAAPRTWCIRFSASSSNDSSAPVQSAPSTMSKRCAAPTNMTTNKHMAASMWPKYPNDMLINVVEVNNVTAMSMATSHLLVGAFPSTSYSKICARTPPWSSGHCTRRLLQQQLHAEGGCSARSDMSPAAGPPTSGNGRVRSFGHRA